MIGSFDLIRFLRRIDYLKGLPERTSIDRIIKFENDNGTLTWDKDLFDKYLMEARDKDWISQKEYQKYIKLVE